MTDFCAKTFYFLSNPFFQVISRTSSTCSPPLQRQAISNCHHNPHPHHFAFGGEIISKLRACLLIIYICTRPSPLAMEVAC